MTRRCIVSCTPRLLSSGCPATIYRKQYFLLTDFTCFFHAPVPPVEYTRLCRFSRHLVSSKEGVLDRLVFPISNPTERGHTIELSNYMLSVLSQLGQSTSLTSGSLWRRGNRKASCHSNSDKRFQCKGRQAYPGEGGIHGCHRGFPNVTSRDPQYSSPL